MGNQMMFLEHNNTTRPHDNRHDYPHDDDNHKQRTGVTCNFDPFKNTMQKEPIKVHNKYHLLINEDDDDSDSGSEEDQQAGDARRRRKTKPYNPNRRQRRRSLLTINAQHNHNVNAKHVHFEDDVFTECEKMTPPWRRCKCGHEDDEAIRDAAASSGDAESDWHAISNHTTTQYTIGSYNSKHVNTNYMLKFGSSRSNFWSTHNYWLKSFRLRNTHNHCYYNSSRCKSSSNTVA